MRITLRTLMVVPQPACVRIVIAAAALAVITAGSSTPELRAAQAYPSLADTTITARAGPLEIATVNPVTITGLEVSTSVYFRLQNTSASAITVSVPDRSTLAQPPFSLLPWMEFQANQSGRMTIQAAETHVAEYLVGAHAGTGTAVTSFRFEVVETGQSVTIPIEVRATGAPRWRDLISNATVSGTVTVDGAPLANVDVVVWPYDHREIYRARTDGNGRYTVNVPAIAEIAAATGARTLPYRNMNHFATVDVRGYTLGFADGIAPAPGETVTRDIAVSRVATPSSYEQVAEIATDGPHGYYWIAANQAFDRFVAVQGQHPPELHRPGHVLIFDDRGTILSRVITPNECWGFDSSADRIAVGCHDGTVAVLDWNGTVLWSRTHGVVVRAVRFSPDGSRLLTGPINTGPDNQHSLVMYDSATGNVVWTYDGYRLPVRSLRFAAGGERIFACFNAGVLTLLDAAGTALWHRYIGEFPLATGVDPSGNIYASGKSEDVVSYDLAGDLRWRYRVPAGPASASYESMGTAGDQFVGVSTSGFVHALDSAGSVRWRRQLPGRGSHQGHNGSYVTPDGQYILVGVAEEGYRESPMPLGTVALFNRDGTLLWTHSANDRRAAGSYNSAQLGAIAVTMSQDARIIAAAYADSTIRIFRATTPPSAAARRPRTAR